MVACSDLLRASYARCRQAGLQNTAGRPPVLGSKGRPHCWQRCLRRLTFVTAFIRLKYLYKRRGIKSQTTLCQTTLFPLTSAAVAGASVFNMMEVSRHKSVDTLRGYVRRAGLFREPAGAGVPMREPERPVAPSDAARGHPQRTSDGARSVHVSR